MLIDFLRDNQIPFTQGEVLASLTTFRIGGKADLVIRPDTEQKAAALIRFLRQGKEKFFVMGRGSDLLFADHDFKTPIIQTDLLCEKKHEGDLFIFGAGVKLSAAAAYAAETGHTGLEFAHGIPGSVGGAVFMNAGAYDGAISDVCVTTRYVDAEGEIRTLSGSLHDFGYRHSFFSEHTDLLILSASFQLTPGVKDMIFAKMDDLMQRRKEKQPLNFPSAGSTFKRPEGAYAAKLIDEAGLKGYSVGGAQVSEKHAGFIINRNNATFEDVTKLIRFVQQTVKEKTGYTLECEVRIVE